MGTARNVALDALVACERQGAWSDGYLKKAIKAAELDGRDAALATRLCFGVLQNRMLLDFYLSQLCTTRLEKLEARDGQDQVVKLTREEDGTYTFTMPESPVTVSAVFGPIFQDVAESDWFYAAVQYVYEQGIMSGVEEGRFEPGTTLTRAMLAQTLYAMEGKPQVSGGEDFSDVEEGDWYAAAVAWAAENGLVSGVGGDRFAPNDALTREQMALILYRYAQHKSYDVQVDGEPLEGFQDVEKISDWAVEAMAWAVNAKLLSGTGDNLLTPAGTATRAQVAQVLANFCQTVA